MVRDLPLSKAHDAMTVGRLLPPCLHLSRRVWGAGEQIVADLSADRNTVAVVQALEAILQRQAAGQPGCVVEVNHTGGGLVLKVPGQAEPVVLYAPRV